MGAPLVVMSHPLCHDSAQIFLAQWDHENPNPPGVCFPLIALWCTHRRAQHPQSKSLSLLVHLSREDRVTVMDQETVRMIARNRFAKLPQGRIPSGRAGHDPEHVNSFDVPFIAEEKAWIFECTIQTFLQVVKSCILHGLTNRFTFEDSVGY